MYNPFKLILSKKDLDKKLDYSNSQSLVDKDGYKITIVPKKEGESLCWNQDEVKLFQEREKNGDTIRSGVMFITDLKGNTVRSGYWMNAPEADWEQDGINLDQNHYSTPRGSSFWDKMNIREKLKLELQAQVSRYKPLKQQFETFFKHFGLYESKQTSIRILEFRNIKNLMDK